MRSAYKDVDEVVKALERSREDDTVYKNLFSKMEKLCGEPLRQPRTARTQTLHANPDVETSYDYYCVYYFLPYVDHLVSDLRRQFEHSTELSNGIYRTLSYTIIVMHGISKQAPNCSMFAENCYCRYIAYYSS